MIKMVMLFRVKGTKNWRRYKGKQHLKFPTSRYDWRLVDKTMVKVLAEGKYEFVLGRLRQIEFFKHRGRG